LASVECDLRLGARDAEAGLHHLERHPGAPRRLRPRSSARFPWAEPPRGSPGV